MISTFYNVSIALTDGSAPANGGIDNTTVEQYDLNGAAASSLANSLAKRRANIRYTFLQQQMAALGNIYIDAIQAAGADANTPPTTFSFVAEVERGDQVLWTRDESNAGAVLTGVPALKRAIARALIEARTVNTSYFDPTTATAPNQSNAAIRVGSRVGPVVVGPVCASLSAAEATVTIAKLL